MDAYRNEGMGEVIVGEPFCKASYVEARRFARMITIFNGKDNVTYQMVRSHPRFKHLTDKQCNKIPPLLKVILDLGPEFIRDKKIVERLILENISLHEME
ncbi:hypothetical protein Tco_1452727 [Tanacetum coccineum]